jgi:hypothetical protein
MMRKKEYLTQCTFRIINKAKGELPGVPLEQIVNKVKKEQKEDIIQFLRTIHTQQEYAFIQPVEKKEYYPLSSAQKRLLFLQQYEHNSTFYNLPYVITWREEISSGKLEGTFRRLISRYESLRTSFHMINNQPVQKIHRQVDFKIEYYRPGPMPYADIIQRFIRPFHLDQAPLLRVGVINTQEGNAIFMLDMHHIIADGISQELLKRDFFLIYIGKKLPALSLQYKDYVQWQNSESQQKIMKSQQSYWLKQFEGEIPLLNLPIDYKRSDKPAGQGKRLGFRIEKELVGRIKQLMSETHTTLYIILLAVYNILLSIYTRQQDIIIGSPVAGRRDERLGNIVGMFVNMLPMRNQPQPTKSFREFLNVVKTNSLNAFENQDYPFDELVEILGIPRDLNRQPLVETVFTLQNTSRPIDPESPQPPKKNYDIKPYPFESNAAMFDLTLDALEEESILMWWSYAAELFKTSTIEKLKKHYIEILEQVLEKIDIKLKDIKISHQLVTAESNPLQTEQGDFGF